MIPNFSNYFKLYDMYKDWTSRQDKVNTRKNGSYHYEVRISRGNVYFSVSDVKKLKSLFIMDFHVQSYTKYQNMITNFNNGKELDIRYRMVNSLVIYGTLYSTDCLSEEEYFQFSTTNSKERIDLYDIYRSGIEYRTPYNLMLRCKLEEINFSIFDELIMECLREVSQIRNLD